MTKRITLVFDLPDGDVSQVEDMLSGITDTFSTKLHLYSSRNPSKDIGNLLDHAMTILPAEVFLSFQDRVNCDLVPNWNKHLVEFNMRTLIDLEIMIDFLSDHLMNSMLRR